MQPNKFWRKFRELHLYVHPCKRRIFIKIIHLCRWSVHRKNVNSLYIAYLSTCRKRSRRLPCLIQIEFFVPANLTISLSNLMKKQNQRVDTGSILSRFSNIGNKTDNIKKMKMTCCKQQTIIIWMLEDYNSVTICSLRCYTIAMLSVRGERNSVE